MGIRWHPSNDSFKFHVVLSQDPNNTKRIVLSNTAKIFYPPGLLGPIITKAKLYMQQLWELKIDWDQKLPSTINESWTEFYNGLMDINQLSFKRCIIHQNYHTLQLHGFSDASEKAYGACLYVTCLDEDRNLLSSHLLCSKSKVAPLKKISLPRLELCGAVILARLIHFAKRIMELQFNETYAWTDSTIVLAWLSKSPNNWKTFVANRVCEIQGLLSSINWHHVPGTQNPADILSRGCNAADLANNQLWMYGPFREDGAFLTPIENHQNIDNLTLQNVECEIRKVAHSFIININDTISNLLAKFSSISKIERIIAIIFQFTDKAHTQQATSRHRLAADQISSASKNVTISASEIKKALHCLIRTIQNEAFNEEISCLKNNHPISSKSKLLTSTPFLDDHQLLRVGGRIHNSNYPESQRHQIILPNKHRLTTMLMEREHVRLLHAAPTLLLGQFRQNYWPINGRNLAKQIYHKCITCFKTQPRSQTQLMGNLPPERVDFKRAFLNIGVDFGGPILILNKTGRGSKAVKAYICLFVCLATKGVHLEAVSDLSTPEFLASLRRFVSRRGYPANIYSDHGKNFVGASRKLYQQFNQIINGSPIQNILNQHQINWHFIPQNSPHMGGIWEAGIKSTKAHLKRIMGNQTLTFEEFSTLLCQIEACLNSRPLAPLSNEPNDLESLTPGHFIIGAAIVSIPESDKTGIPISSLPRWKVVQQKFQHFWKRYSLEYVNILQQRTKWKTSSANLTVGDLVLIKDENLPPLRWNMGRVTAIHPGSDQYVRVITLKTKNGTVQRTIHKICKIPI